jgi:multiple sugar transport system ATP-binding protein
MASALEIKSINKRFGKGAKQVEVLKHIDIDVQPGEFLILVGPSGCGKSTLLNIIAGLDEPSEGEIHIGGRCVAKAGERAQGGGSVNVPSAQRDIAMVFQSYALYPTMSVADNIGFALEMRKMPKPERLQRIDQVATMLQIKHLLDRRPSQLSGGQRQRVAMGRALARQPQLFLFDEPLSNLDAKLRVEMRAEIKRLHQVSGITSVYVTHDQIEAMTLGSRIAVMKDGLVQQLGTPAQIYGQPANTFVASFIGSPTMNMLPVAASPIAVAAGAATLGIRPEHVLIDPASPWRATVGLIEPTGADTYVIVQAGEHTLTLRVAPNVQLASGDTVGLTLQPDQAHWFDAAGMRLP